MNAWIEIRAIFDSPPADTSIYADAFDRYGCPGSVESITPPSITGYMASVGRAMSRSEELRRELMALGADSVNIGQVQNEDWSVLWKAHFKPRRVGKRFVIRPTWDDSLPAPMPGQNLGDLVIVLDPGQAFGTGDHPTTRLCVELIEGIDLRGKAVADIGCGSGVLAIAAEMLGADTVVAADIDPISVEVANANFALNKASCKAVLGDGFAVVEQQCDIVLSNIISATLIRLAPEAALALKQGGSWVVSGIIEANWHDVLDAAIRCGFVLDRKVSEDDWVGAVLSRRTASCRSTPLVAEGVDPPVRACQ